MYDQTITGQLVARTGIHVGSGRGNNVTDGLCRRDVEGQLIIPGTALGGALRTLAVRLAPRLGSPVCRDLKPSKACDSAAICPCWVCRLFGHSHFPDTDEEDVSPDWHASRLGIDHAVAVLPEGSPLRIRDGVGIDRVHRASARAGSIKYDLEVVPAGTTFDLQLHLEKIGPEEARLLAAILAEWQNGRCWIGGRSARGLGAFDLCQVKVCQHQLASPEGLMAFLAADDPLNVATPADTWFPTMLATAAAHVQDAPEHNSDVAQSFAALQFDLHIDGPFLTNDTAAAALSGYNHVPWLDRLSPDGKPILSGSSLRGVWRAQAERIARTLATQAAVAQTQETDAEPVGRRFLKLCPACNPVATRADASLANCDVLLRDVAKVPDDKEVSEAHLCLACWLFGSTRRGSRLRVEDALATAPMSPKIFDFVAIDRFTGGGRDGAKFDALTAWKPTFRVRMHLENPQPWEMGWLLLVWRDLQEGMIPVGFGAAKGFGRTRLSHGRLQHGLITERDALSNDVTRATTERQGLYQVYTWDREVEAQEAELLDLGEIWVEAFRRQVDTFERRELPAPATDTYFNAEIMTLYDAEAYQCLLTP